jgi:EAL domain-containing protein (putative c-di-GMP-specific phosphodiesterase class I)
LIRLTGIPHEYVERSKKINIDVIVGNIATPEAALFLVENGADGESRN